MGKEANPRSRVLVCGVEAVGAVWYGVCRSDNLSISADITEIPACVRLENN